MAAERPGAAAGVIADLAVVGAGAIGLATALAAAERGARVVVVERERPGAGQSGGPGRVFRHITDSPERVELARRGRLAWRAAEERLGVPLLGSQGALLVGAPTDHAGRLARLECFLPTGCTEAPTVAGLKAGEIEIGLGRAEIVAAQLGEGEKLGRHLDADRVQSKIVGARVTAAGAEEAGQRPLRAALEGLAINIALPR